MLIDFLSILEKIEREQGMTGTLVAILVLAITSILAMGIIYVVAISWAEVFKWAVKIIFGCSLL